MTADRDSRTLTIALCGDVMLGRGIDQILPHPGDPTLRESFVRDARDYVRFAEEANGAVPRPVDPTWPWGDALEVLDDAAPDVRIVNLETSVTTADDFAVGKRVHYRMHPDNLEALSVVRPACTTLANNHVLDFGRDGLAETLRELSRAGLATAGAGRDAPAARRPCVAVPDTGGRVLVFSVGMPSSGVPLDWAASDDRAGVDYLPGASPAAARRLTRRIAAHKRPGDIVVVSLHWGSNWGYDVGVEMVRFAHTIIDGGADVVHGHSSHHPRPFEVHNGRLVLYGCGDLVNDYEGIAGHERYRGELRLLYLLRVDTGTGALRELRMMPLRGRRLRLERASAADAAWLADRFTRINRPLGTPAVHRASDGSLSLRR